MTNRQSRGFTLVEIVFVIPMLMMLTLIMLWLLSHLVRAGGSASRGATEMCLAARFSEQLRSDIRQATRAIITGETELRLSLPDGEVAYRLGAEHRAERVAADGSVATGPMLHGLRFSRQPAANARAGTMIGVVMRCTADAALEHHAEAPAGRTLIVDTALRAQDAEVLER